VKQVKKKLNEKPILQIEIENNEWNSSNRKSSNKTRIKRTSKNANRQLKNQKSKNRRNLRKE
jgi:hypothetical protein